MVYYKTHDIYNDVVISEDSPSTIPDNISETPLEHESLDARWYKRYREFGSWAGFEHLGGKKEARDGAQADFFASETENPTLDYPKLGVFPFEEYEIGLLELKRDIIEQENNETVKRAYRWVINEKLAELRMLKSANSQDWRRFSRYCTFVHGEPSSDIFNYTVQLLHQDLAEFIQTNASPELETLSTELTALLPQKEFSPEKSLSQPAPSLFKLIQDQTRQEMLGVLAEPLIKTTYTSEEVQAIMSTVLENMQIQGWEVIVNEDVSNMSVSQQKKQVTISSKDVAVGTLEDLIMHEIGRHVQRREKGEQSKLQLLGLGLDRYEKGEEGVATIAEQGLQEKFDDYSKLDRHLAIALARGVDGNPRDFRQVFIIMEKYYQFIEAKDGKQGEEAIKLARESAWAICIRVFRGTDCKSPGVCFTKDIAYALGNVDVWKVLGMNPDEMTKFTVGKYDPSNSRHMLILSQLGITDSDLKNLEE